MIPLGNEDIFRLYLLNIRANVQVSDTTDGDSSNAAKFIKQKSNHQKMIAIRRSIQPQSLSGESLQMNRLAIGHLDSIFNAFANGWVRMNSIQHFMISGFQLTGNHSFGNHFRYVITNHMRA